MSLCQDFKILSYETWFLLEHARLANHQIKEETITDLLMIYLKLNNLNEIITKTFNHKEEKKNGSDWEWWLVDSTGKKGLGFRVQAKIVNFKTNSFQQLYYKYQNNVLIRQALNSKKKLIPIYCLYSHDSLLLKPEDGCSIISAYAIKKWKSTKKLSKIKDVKRNMFPWHFLVCLCDSSSINASLPLRAWELGKQYGLAEGMGIENNDGLPNNGDLPDYVLKLIENQRRNDGDDNEPDVGSEFDDLRGIMIIKDNDELG